MRPSLLSLIFIVSLFQITCIFAETATEVKNGSEILSGADNARKAMDEIQKEFSKQLDEFQKEYESGKFSGPVFEKKILDLSQKITLEKNKKLQEEYERGIISKSEYLQISMEENQKEVKVLDAKYRKLHEMENIKYKTNKNKYKEKMVQAIKEQEREIVFTGMVVDFDNQPIENALVKASVRQCEPKEEYFTKDKEIEVKTNKSGIFKVKSYGTRLMINSIEKEGYIYQKNYSEHNNFEYDKRINDSFLPNDSSGKKGIPINPEPKNTYTFRIRKQDKLDYLVQKSFSYKFSKTKNEPFLPTLINDWTDYYGERKNEDYYYSKEAKNLEFSVEFNEEYSEYVLAIKCLNTDSGVIISNELLFEAPADGYRQKIEYSGKFKPLNEGSFASKDSNTIYLYVKGPKESYYSRIELNVVSTVLNKVEPNLSVQISGETFTNPEGRRSLDYNKTFNDEERMFRDKLNRERNEYLKEQRKNVSDRLKNDPDAKLKLDLEINGILTSSKNSKERNERLRKFQEENDNPQKKYEREIEKEMKKFKKIAEKMRAERDK